LASAQSPQSPASAKPATHRAEVVYSANLLQVTANNSSLNQILRQIAQATGLKISGGVADERVYGSYGPAPVDHVLESLLDGTGSNMILRETPQKTPGELILTPRNGGPTPPNPAMSSAEDDEPAPLPPPQPAANPNPGVPSLGSRLEANPPVTMPNQTTDTLAPGGIPGTSPIAPAPGTTSAPAAPGSSDPATGTNTPATNTTPSPNGVKTPQQIYLELQQLQQQQPATPH